MRVWSGTMNVAGSDLGIQLDGKSAPQAVANFITLAKQGFYNGLNCHRLTTEGIFVLQCGDPNGDGTGGPGYNWGPIENAPADNIYKTGVLAMARVGNDAGSMGSQFFIVYADSPIPADSVGGYTVFGKITKGYRGAVVESLLRKTNLWDVRKERLGGYSGGMRRRLEAKERGDDPASLKAEKSGELAERVALERQERRAIAAAGAPYRQGGNAVTTRPRPAARTIRVNSPAAAAASAPLSRRALRAHCRQAHPSTPLPSRRAAASAIMAALSVASRGMGANTVPRGATR